MLARRALPLVLAGLALTSAPARAQVVVTGGGTYTQTFDNPPTAMPTSGSTPWVQNSIIPGWYAVRSGAGTDIAAGDGTLSAINLYSFGTSTNADRALGSIGGVTGAVNNYAWGVVFRNEGALPLNLTISYVGEQWRASAAGNAQRINFTYQESASPITEAAFNANELSGDGTFLMYGSGANFPLDFISPQTPPGATDLNGNLAQNRLLLSSDFTAFTGKQLDPGEYIAFRWWDRDHSGTTGNVTDHGLAIDDLTITFTPVPEPGTVLAVSAAGLGLAGVLRRVRRGK